MFFLNLVKLSQNLSRFSLSRSSVIPLKRWLSSFEILYLRFSSLSSLRISVTTWPIDFWLITLIGNKGF